MTAGATAQRNVFGGGRAQQWTRERISRLSAQDIKQLRANAERLGEADLVALCDELLSGARSASAGPRGGAARTKARKLIARIRAFEARGVFLRDPKTSWGGVRKSDGAVVIALWADAIASADGGCSYLLWRPNVEGAWPWADVAGGRERLEHCELALKLGRAEGLLVYGQALVGRLPEDKAYSVQGVDAETVIPFRVEQRGAEYWAVWGKASASSA